MCLRIGNIVCHLNIHKDGNLFRLNYNDRFDTLTDLIIHYMMHMLKNNTGIKLPLFIPIESYELSNERWFHGLISKKESTYVILRNGHSGSYLVRVSQSEPGNYVLAINVNDKVVEIKIISNVSIKMLSFYYSLCVKIQNIGLIIKVYLKNYTSKLINIFKL